MTFQQDDVIVADNMEGYDIGQIVNLDKVLLVGSKTATLVGKPLVSGANVRTFRTYHIRCLQINLPTIGLFIRS